MKTFEAVNVLFRCFLSSYTLIDGRKNAKETNYRAVFRMSLVVRTHVLREKKKLRALWASYITIIARLLSRIFRTPLFTSRHCDIGLQNNLHLYHVPHIVCGTVGKLRAQA